MANRVCIAQFFKKSILGFFFFGILFLGTSCSVEPNALELCEVSFAQVEEKSIYVNYSLQNLPKLDNVVIYFNCKANNSTKAYCEKGGDQTIYVRYDGSFCLSQGSWSFDALIFSKDEYHPTDASYKIEAGTDAETGETLYKESILVSDKANYLKSTGAVHACNTEVFIHLKTTSIVLHIDSIGGNNGALNFTYGASSDYVSKYVAGDKLPDANANSYKNQQITTSVAKNNFQKIVFKIYSFDDLQTALITKEASPSEEYINEHFEDKVNKAFLLQLKFEALSLNPGSYIGVIQVFEDEAKKTTTRTITMSSSNKKTTYSYTDSTQTTYPTYSGNPVWYEHVAFTITEGEITYINGRAGIGSTPPKPESGRIIVSGDDKDIDSIQESTVTGDYTYVINPNKGSDDTYTLNNTDIDPGNGSRIEIAEGVTNFTVDLNGTNVRTDVDENREDTTIFTLEGDVTANIVNNESDKPAVIGGTTSSTTTSTGSQDEFEEIYATIEVAGGTLNVLGSETTSGPGHTPEIIISGPSRNAGFTGREGAINLSSTGGTINLDGNVAIGAPITDFDEHKAYADQTVKGITCFFYDDGTNKTTTVTEGPRNININLSNGASIYANGDSNETPAGIYLVGDNSFSSNDSINVNLDNANIVVGVNHDIDSGAGEQATGYGMRFENCGSAPITINIKDSIIADNHGDVFSFANCSGDIHIVIDNSQIGGAGNEFTAFYFENCSGSITIELKNNSCIKSAGCFGFGNWVDTNNQNFYFKNCSGNKAISADNTCEFWLRSEPFSSRSSEMSHIYNSTQTNLTVDGHKVTTKTTYVNGAWTTKTQGTGGAWLKDVTLTNKTMTATT